MSLQPIASLCSHCGDAHTGECRASLSIRLADERVEHAISQQADHIKLCALELEVTDLRWQITQSALSRYHA